MALLCAALLLWFNRLIFTRLISPAQQGTVPVFAVIPAVGDGDGLEQTLRHLHWLQGEKLSQFTLLAHCGRGTDPRRTGPGPGTPAQRHLPALLPGRGGHPHPEKEGRPWILLPLN